MASHMVGQDIVLVLATTSRDILYSSIKHQLESLVSVLVLDIDTNTNLEQEVQAKYEISLSEIDRQAREYVTKCEADLIVPRLSRFQNDQRKSCEKAPPRLKERRGHSFWRKLMQDLVQVGLYSTATCCTNGTFFWNTDLMEFGPEFGPSYKEPDTVISQRSQKLFRDVRASDIETLDLYLREHATEITRQIDMSGKDTSLLAWLKEMVESKKVPNYASTLRGGEILAVLTAVAKTHHTVWLDPESQRVMAPENMFTLLQENAAIQAFENYRKYKDRADRPDRPDRAGRPAAEAGSVLLPPTYHFEISNASKRRLWRMVCTYWQWNSAYILRGTQPKLKAVIVVSMKERTPRLAMENYASTLRPHAGHASRANSSKVGLSSPKMTSCLNDRLRTTAAAIEECTFFEFFFCPYFFAT
jgi:hypothetical protein